MRLMDYLYVLPMLLLIAGCTQNIGQLGIPYGGNSTGYAGNGSGAGNAQENPGGLVQDSSNGTVIENVTGGNSAASTKGFAVDIKNFAFSPTAITVHKGDSVLWSNNDRAPHTITSDSGSELGSGTLEPGQTYTHTFNTIGTFNYHCSIHPMMKAQVIVQ